MRVVFQERRRHHLSTHAPATLRGLGFQKRLLHRVQQGLSVGSRGRQPLQRADLCANDGANGRNAGAHCLPVHMHRATATEADPAADFAAGQSEFIAQDPDEHLARRGIHRTDCFGKQYGRTQESLRAVLASVPMCVPVSSISSG